MESKTHFGHQESHDDSKITDTEEHADPAERRVCDIYECGKVCQEIGGSYLTLTASCSETNGCACKDGERLVYEDY
ncbi:hypothetical protein J6590_002729 [Homalodisca vitripennis]|nr:hypothetical protein J6590_002729 [Homalodisca vitripennis]